MKPVLHRYSPHSWHHFPRMAALILVIAVLLISCTRTETTDVPTAPTPTITTTIQPTRLPTLTPTPHPLGSQENPLVIGVVSESADPLVEQAQQEIARLVAGYTGKTVTSQVYSDYPALVQALEDGSVHITWLPPLTYLYVSRRGLAESVMITSHFGVYQYGAQFMANVESNFTPYFDPISGYTSADAATALAQFADMRPCWVDAESTSGYIVPAGALSAEAVSTLPPVFTQTHTAVVRALYIKGICDFGATFSTSGDPRTSSAVLTDLPDALNRVIIIWRTYPIIPNLNLSFMAGLDDRNRQDLINAFLEINRSANGKNLLSVAAGNYQIEDLKVIEDSLYNPMRQMVDALDLDVQELIGK